MPTHCGAMIASFHHQMALRTSCHGMQESATCSGTPRVSCDVSIGESHSNLQVDAAAWTAFDDYIVEGHCF